MIQQTSNPLATIFSSDSAVLRRELAELNEEYTRLLNWQDIVIRALRNSKFSPIYTSLYLSLIDTYPQLLAGEPADINVWRVRENAGWVPERSTTNFFADMQAINAIAYDAGKFEKKGENRTGRVTPIPDHFDVPEGFDTSSTDRKRRAKEKEAERRKQFKNPRQLLQCEECGSEELFWDATPYCMACGHRHETIKDIPASAITIDAEVIEIDSFVDEPTTPRLAVVKPGENITRTITPAPVALPLLAIRPVAKDLRGLARPDDFCRRCGRLRRDCFENQEGTWWYTCTDEQAEQWRKAGPHEYSGH